MKKTLILLFIFLAAISAVILVVSKKTTISSNAGSDGFTLSGSKDSVKLNKSYTLTIKVTATEAMQSVNGLLTYDADRMEYEAEEQSAFVGSNGTLTLSDTFAKPTREKTYKLKFKACSTGDCLFTLSDNYYTCYKDLSVQALGSSTATVTILVNDGIEDDSTLSELLIGTGELNPAFQSSQYEYEVQVPKDTTVFTYSASPTAEDATVVSDGPEKLSEGRNVYKITVIAPSGDKSIYTIAVIRE